MNPPDLTPDHLTAYLHREIPLTAAAGIVVSASTARHVELRAPLALNRNPHGTVFGGSLAMLGIVSGWTLVHRALLEAGMDVALVVKTSECDYLAPATGEAVARGHIDEADWNAFTARFAERGRARITVETRIESQGVEAVVHRGVFVALSHS